MVDYDFPQATRALTRQARRMGQDDAVRTAHTPATVDTVATRKEATRYTVTEVTGYTGEGDGMEAIVRTHLLSRDELADLFGDERQADSLIENGRLGEHDEWMIQSTSARRTATHSLDWHAAPDQWWGASVDGIQIIVQPRAGSYEYVVEGPGASLSGTSPTLADAKAAAEATAYDEFL